MHMHFVSDSHFANAWSTDERIINTAVATYEEEKYRVGDKTISMFICLRRCEQ